MRIAYLLVVHHKPQQFARLFSAIHNRDDTYVIHVDRKSPEEVHRSIAGIVAGLPNVHVLPDRPIVWGGWSIAAMGLEAIRWLLKNDPGWHYFINLSGQDYPLKPPEAIRSELAESPERNYIECSTIKSYSPGEQSHLLRRLRFSRFEQAGRIIGTPFPTWRWGVRTEWKGSGWYTITRAFCQWATTDPLARRCIRAVRRTYIPDEFLIQTLAMNGPFVDTLAGSNLREIVWTGEAHPATLTMQHRELLLGSAAHFARKFDANIDAEILNTLDRHIGTLL